MWQVIRDENGTQAIVEGERTEFNYSYIRTLQDVKRWRLFRWNRRYQLPKNKKYAPGALLIAAAENGSVPLVKALLRQGIPVDSPDENGDTALSAAVNRGKASMVALLLARGAKANRADEWGTTPLMKVSVVDTTERCMRLLLHHGANPREWGSGGETVLHRAAGAASWRMVSLLLAAGAPANALSRKEGTPLHNAACVSVGSESDSIKIARLLLQQGADSRACDQDGRTPLHAAARSGSAAMVRLLLDAGGDVNARTFGTWRDRDTTPLHEVASVWQGDPEERIRAAHLLLAAGANPFARTANKDTPLTCAARSGNPRMVALLLLLGASSNDRVLRGASAIELARSQTGRMAEAEERERYEKVIELLTNAPSGKRSV